MSFDNHANFALANVTVAPSPATSGTSLTVDSAILFPSPPFNAVCWPATVLPTAASAEILRITSTGSNTFTVARAQEGSTAQAISSGYQIAASLTAKILMDIESAIGSGGTSTDILQVQVFS